MRPRSRPDGPRGRETRRWRERLRHALLGLLLTLPWSAACSFVPDPSAAIPRSRDSGQVRGGDDVNFEDASMTDLARPDVDAEIDAGLTDADADADADTDPGPDMGTGGADVDAGAPDTGSLDAGTVDSGVDGGRPDASPMPTTCGNGELEADEICDDGNTDINDGCTEQCLVEPDWICLRQPSVCVLLNDAVFVQSNGAFGCGSRTGAETDPFCSIDDALDEKSPVIIVRPGVYSESLVSEYNVVVIAYPGAEIRGREWSIDAGHAEIVGLSFVDSDTFAVRVRSDASLVLSECTIRGAWGYGVTIESRADAMLDRNLISENRSGGLRVKTSGVVEISNNVLWANGHSRSSFGGVRIEEMVGQGSRFAYNTIVENEADSGRAAGVRCDRPVSIRNSIVWNNHSNEPSALSGACVVESSIVGPNWIASGSTLVVDPELKSDFHLQASSPAIDRADPDGLESAFDIDGESRVQGGAPDMGADELHQ
ncbi:MAG: right-handed parallel beta-helix repeat-containing protein [Deltaproteobacteria bacterium]|nr:right-handed parallel beta-helix repeat-containing protein [Deltaproteobacteria bacterium]